MKLKLGHQTKKSLSTYIMMAVVFVIVEILLNTGNLSNMFKGLLIPLCFYSIMAVSLNLTVGILGELSLGQAGFMCVGAYTSAVFSVLTKQTLTEPFLRFFAALLVGGLSAAIFGILIGIPVLRLRGDYLAIVTLAFGEIIKNVFSALYIGYDSDGVHLSLQSQGDLHLGADGKMLINGAIGISGVPKDSTFEIAFGILFVIVIIAYNFINSRTGRAVMSIRDNRIAAESIGLNITKYKLITFALTAFTAGIGGAIYSHNFASLQASKFDYNLSILILVFVVLGGIGSIKGCIISTVILTLIPELLRSINNYRMLIYSIVLIFMMILTSNTKCREFFVSRVSAIKKLFVKDKSVKIKEGN